MRTYRATDPCGNFADCTQLITVNDTMPPIIISCGMNMTVECVEDIPPPDRQ